LGRFRTNKTEPTEKIQTGVFIKWKTFSRPLFQKEGFEIWGCSFVSQTQERKKEGKKVSELKLSSAEKNFQTRFLGLLEKQSKIWRYGRS